MRRALAALCACWLAGAGEASAQIEDNETAFSVERYAPPPGPSVFFTAEDAEVLEHLAWSAALRGSLSARPLVFADIQTGEEVTQPVSHRLGYDLAFALGLGERYQVGLGVPIVAAQEGDRLRGVGLSEERLQTAALGDVRLHGKARVLGAPAARGLGAALSAAVQLPTGEEDHFAGEKGAILAWRLVGSYRRRSFALALNLGTRIRTEEVVLLEPARKHGNEIVGALAGELLVPGTGGRLRALGEWAFAEGDGDGPSPAELRAGARLRFAAGWTVGAGVGFGTTPDEVGAPAWRLIGTVEVQAAPTTDVDGDGVRDSRDFCPEEAEDPDGFADADGCPEPDNDGDGFADEEDACPQRSEDRDGWRDADGCPESDNDGDGVEDERDLCPEHLGPRARGGCPADVPDLAAPPEGGAGVDSPGRPPKSR